MQVLLIKIHYIKHALIPNRPLCYAWHVFFLFFFIKLSLLSPTWCLFSSSTILPCPYHHQILITFYIYNFQYYYYYYYNDDFIGIYFLGVARGGHRPNSLSTASLVLIFVWNFSVPPIAFEDFFATAESTS